MRRDRARLRGLYAITPASTDTAGLVRRVVECLEGGAALIQYRAKDVQPGLALIQARALLEVCRQASVPLIVNDSIELAAAVGADGVHLGRDDAGVREARILMPGALVGVSCYDDPERARAAARDGADYVGIGSMFPSTTKPGAVHASLEMLAQARRASGLPVAAIGGITADNAATVVAAGADMLAIISAVFDAADVRRTARSIASHFDPPRGTPDERSQPQPV